MDQDKNQGNNKQTNNNRHRKFYILLYSLFSWSWSICQYLSDLFLVLLYFVFALFIREWRCSPSCSSLSILFTIPGSFLINVGKTRLIFLVRFLVETRTGKISQKYSHSLAPSSFSSGEGVLLDIHLSILETFIQSLFNWFWIHFDCESVQTTARSVKVTEFYLMQRTKQRKYYIQWPWSIS